MNEEDEIVIDHGEIEVNPDKKEETIIISSLPEVDHGIVIEVGDEIVIEDERIPKVDHPIIIDTPEEIASPGEEETPVTPGFIDPSSIDNDDIDFSSTDPTIQYYWDPYESGFVVKGIHEILDTFLPINEVDYYRLLDLRDKGYYLYIKNGELTVSDEPRPSPLHQWSGSKWIVSRFEWFQHHLQETLQRLENEADAFIQEHIEEKLPSNQYDRETFKAINIEIKDWALDNKLDTPMTRVFCEALDLPLEQFLIQKSTEIRERQFKMTKVVALKMKYAIKVKTITDIEEFDKLTFSFNEVLNS